MKCEICGKEGVCLYGASHKDLGHISMCQDCWTQAYEKNLLVSGSGSGSGSCASCSRSCSCCP